MAATHASVKVLEASPLEPLPSPYAARDQRVHSFPPNRLVDVPGRVIRELYVVEAFGKCSAPSFPERVSCKVVDGISDAVHISPGVWLIFVRNARLSCAVGELSRDSASYEVLDADFPLLGLTAADRERRVVVMWEIDGESFNGRN